MYCSRVLVYIYVHMYISDSSYPPNVFAMHTQARIQVCVCARIQVCVCARMYVRRCVIRACYQPNIIYDNIL